MMPTFVPMLFTTPMVQAIEAGRKTQTRRMVTRHNSLVDGKPATAAQWAALDWGHCEIVAPVKAFGVYGSGAFLVGTADTDRVIVAPRVVPANVIWVRETWGAPHCDPPGVPGGIKPAPTGGRESRIVYLARPADAWQWFSGYNAIPARPSIHMPAWAARFEFPVSSVRAELGGTISEHDALAEGIECLDPDMIKAAGGPRFAVDQWRDDGNFVRGALRPFARHVYAELWDSINGAKPGGRWRDRPPVWVYEWEANRVHHAKAIGDTMAACAIAERNWANGKR